jgi:hypothetical protein
MHARHHTFDANTALIGIAFISPLVTLIVGAAFNDILGLIAMVWCIAMSVITAMRAE